MENRHIRPVIPLKKTKGVKDSGSWSATRIVT